MVDCKIDPFQAVPPLVDTEGDGIALTASGAALIHHQGAASAGEAPLDTAGQVPLRVAPVAVEHQFDGGAGGKFVVGGIELQTVKGGNFKMFPGKLPDFPNPGFHLLVKGLIDRACGQVEFLFPGLPGWSIEGHPVADIADQQKGHCNS